MAYWVKRCAASIFLLLGITLISFVMMKAAPGDPTSIYKDPNVSAEDLDQIRRNLGLDKPVMVQYGKWLSHVIRGDFGFSYVSGQPVGQLIMSRLPATLLLSVTSLVLILLITLPLGVLSGYKKDSAFDRWVMFFSFLGLSIPAFWLGLVLMLGLSVQLKLFPSSGYLNPMLFNANPLVKAVNILWHMMLPLLTIICGGLAGLTRYHRFGMIKELGKDYIKALRARNIPEKIILYKHALKNAALPLITILGLSLPGLISGSFVIEYIFAWPGLGKLGVDAVFSRDYPVLMGTLLLSSILIILGNLLADMAYAWVDPRLRRGGRHV